MEVLTLTCEDLHGTCCDSCPAEQAAGYETTLDDPVQIEGSASTYGAVVQVRRCCQRVPPAAFELKEILARRAAREAWQ